MFRSAVESDYMYRKAFSWLKIPQNNLFFISLFLFQRKINPHKYTAKNEIDASCKRKPLHSTLAFEWVSFAFFITSIFLFLCVCDVYVCVCVSDLNYYPKQIVILAAYPF